MQAIHITENDSILIVAPHPDDEAIGTGGILAIHPLLCDVLVLTDGRQGQGDIAPKKGKEIREKEFTAEMKHAKIKNYRMLGIEDGTLLSHTDCLHDIDLSGYTKIFVTDVHDDHPDHSAAYLSVMSALQAQDIADTEVYAYEVHAPIQTPTHYLDITDVIEKKKQLIRFHPSQLKTLPYDLLAQQSAQYRATLYRMPGQYIEVYNIAASTDLKTDSYIETEQKLQKQTVITWILTRWMRLLSESGSIAGLLRKKGYDTVAVYGYGDLGQLLVKELIKEGIKVPYVMDQRAEQMKNTAVPVVFPTKNLEKPAAVVVTTALSYDELQARLAGMGFQNILSLRHLVEE